MSSIHKLIEALEELTEAILKVAQLVEEEKEEDNEEARTRTK